MRGYVGTAVDTLTTEMDRQFKELKEDMHKRFDEVFTAITDHSHGP